MKMTIGTINNFKKFRNGAYTVCKLNPDSEVGNAFNFM